MTFRNTNIFFALVITGSIAYDWQNHIPIIVYLLLFLVYSLITFWGTVSLSSQFFGPAKCKGEESRALIALTFDDGPDPKATAETLEILRNHGAKATFFCIGKNVKANPELAKQIVLEGHTIGNHSFYHGALFDLQSQRKMLQEINNTNAIIEEVTGKRPRFFRPPYGVMNPMLASAIKKSAMINAGWSVRSFDTIASNKNELLKRLTKNLKGGDVILFHDRCKITREILPELLSLITKTGLKTDTLENVLKEKAYA
jgi:peptidoglycan-N-acetylglucosamine deacetylase